MFTGIIEETGKVLSCNANRSGWHCEVSAQAVLADVAIGDSIGVNGCCLTVVEFTKDKFGFDLLAESRRLTTFEDLQPGELVNLERAVRFNGRMGGHFVTGHIDGVGEILQLEQRGADTLLRVQAPQGTGRYLVRKGSIAIDGVSLTVAEVADDEFAVWLIPHTMETTNLHAKSVGAGVNLEFDQLGKYVEKLVSPTLG